MLMPRFFLHAHLAALDVPVAMAWFAVVFIFWKTVDRKGWGWGLLWGLSWGLATAVKLNGVFIPLGIAAWVLLFRRTWLNGLRLFVMGLTAVITFFLAWPWLYYQTWERVTGYINYHLNHDLQGQWYLGQVFVPPPWHFVFVILWAVIPLAILTLFLAGIIRSMNENAHKDLGWLLMLNIFAAIFPFIFGNIPIYDNERLFMPVFPFMAALAGIGFGWLTNLLQKLALQIKRPRLAAPLIWIMGIALLMPQSINIVKLYPNLLSYYSESVGGLPGATRLGLESTYWCETFMAALPYINTHAKPGDLIWAEDTQWAQDSVLGYYQEIGLLRKDIEISRFPAEEFPQDGDWFIYQYRQSQFGPGGEENYSLYQTLKTQDPVYELYYQGIPLMGLYGRLE